MLVLLIHLDIFILMKLEHILGGHIDLMQEQRMQDGELITS